MRAAACDSAFQAGASCASRRAASVFAGLTDTVSPVSVFFVALICRLSIRITVLLAAYRKDLAVSPCFVGIAGHV